VAFLRDGRPLEYTSSVMRADRYQITLDLVAGTGCCGRCATSWSWTETGAEQPLGRGENKRRIG
jgi:hypothetical protein